MTVDSESPYLLARYEGRRPPAPAWFQTALQQVPERTFFQSQGAQIELLTWGKVGNPGLLFLHGNGAHADWWSAIAPFFAEDWRCATLSWSGMGRSDRRSEGYFIQTFAQEARDAIAAAQFDTAQPVIVIGHSMGGMVGISAAADQPDIDGLVLVDSPLAMKAERLDTLRAGAPKAHPTRRPFASLDEGLARFRLSPPQPCINDYMVDQIARAALVEEDGQWFWHFDPRRFTILNAGPPPIGQVTCPMAYLYGDRSAMIDAHSLKMTADLLPPGTPMISIPEAAHHVPLDQPLALVAALRALLACWPATGKSWADSRQPLA